MAMLQGAAWYRERPVARPARTVLYGGWAMMRTGGTAGGDAAASPGLLLRAVAEQHDRAAFATLFAYYAPRLKSYMARLGADPESAEELAQEAMLTVWRKAVLYDPGKAAAGTWIFTIARNLRVDTLRRERRPEFDPNDPSLLPEPTPRADDVLATVQESTRVRAAMERLSDEQARLVAMSFFDDKPHSAIAAELRLPLGTVKSRIRQALQRIRTELGALT